MKINMTFVKKYKEYSRTNLIYSTYGILFLILRTCISPSPLRLVSPNSPLSNLHEIKASIENIHMNTPAIKQMPVRAQMERR